MKDAIIDAAIETLAVALHGNRLVADFVTLYQSAALPDWQEATNYMEYAPPLVSVEDSQKRMLPLLQEFHSNLYSVDVETGVSNLAPPELVMSVTENAKVYAAYIVDKCIVAATNSKYSGGIGGVDIAKRSHDEFLNAVKARQGLLAIELWGRKHISSPLHVQAQRAALEDLKHTVVGAKASASFSCGGFVTISNDIAVNSAATRKAVAPPVVLHWDTSDDQSRKIIFGSESSETAETQTTIQEMCNSCQLASFGRQGQDVYDPAYRQALKLEPSQFTTNFHPHDYGILDELAQILLPAYLGDREDEDLIGVHAELYKLNVYEGPSGKFKSHVDTPRSDNQLGSLVVCLPSYHEGGNLIIRHNNRALTFDWGRSQHIEWAAFYSDCEHEVLKVTNGHRVTLTYNLSFIYTRGVSSPSLKIDTTPLYNDLQAALQSPGFLAEGGVLGFACNHSYAHNRKDAHLNLPSGLKGIDMILYSALRSLGLKVAVRPVFDGSKLKEMEDDEDYDDNDRGDMDEDDDDLNDDEIQYPGRALVSQSTQEMNTARERLIQFQLTGAFHPRTASGDEAAESTLVLEYEKEEEDEEKSRLVARQTFKSRLAYIKATRRIHGVTEPVTKSGAVDRVGHRFHETELPDGEFGDLSEVRGN